jgi:endonuclease/exonuclease/phosphatase family metal-dependent hydrolase
MKRLGNILWILISFTATAILAVTLLIPYIPPQSPFNIISSLNLAFPYALIFSILCAVICLIRRQFYTFLWVFIILLLSIPNIVKSFGFSGQQPATTPTLSVTSYNVHYFNFYDKDEPNALLYLQENQTDILCIQELLVLPENTHTLGKLTQTLSQYPYHHIYFTHQGKRMHKGIATFSKYPIIKQEIASIDSKSHAAISSWIKVNNDTLQVINCYLESNRLTREEKDVYKSDEKTNIIRRIYNKLAQASQKRGKQAELVAALKDSTCATLVCGDLNDVATSYVYRTIAQDDTDTFLHLQSGIGNTFHEGLYRFRIDYIFADKHIEPLSFGINKQPYSDHYPIELQCNIK